MQIVQREIRLYYAIILNELVTIKYDIFPVNGKVVYQNRLDGHGPFGQYDNLIQLSIT